MTSICDMDFQPRVAPRSSLNLACVGLICMATMGQMHSPAQPTMQVLATPCQPPPLQALERLLPGINDMSRRPRPAVASNRCLCPRPANTSPETLVRWDNLNPPQYQSPASDLGSRIKSQGAPEVSMLMVCPRLQRVMSHNLELLPLKDNQGTTNSTSR